MCAGLHVLFVVAFFWQNTDGGLVGLQVALGQHNRLHGQIKGDQPIADLHDPLVQGALREFVPLSSEHLHLSVGRQVVAELRGDDVGHEGLTSLTPVHPAVGQFCRHDGVVWQTISGAHDAQHPHLCWHDLHHLGDFFGDLDSTFGQVVRLDDLIATGQMTRQLLAHGLLFRLHDLLALDDHLFRLHLRFVLRRWHVKQRRVIGIQRAALLAARAEDHFLNLRELMLEGLDLVGLRLDLVSLRLNLVGLQLDLSIPFLDAGDGSNERLDEFFARGVCELFGGRSHAIKDGPKPL